MSVLGQFDLTGNTALVTGASLGGIGFHTAATLAELGAEVWLSDHPSTIDALEKAGHELTARGARVHLHSADVTDEKEVDGLVQEVRDTTGRLDVLAHHAGINLRKPTRETSLGEWQKVLDVNVTGTWLVTRAASALMAEIRGGRMITLGSVYNRIVGPMPEAAYYASKGAVGSLTRGLAMEFAPSGITVNCIAPGLFYPTRMTEPLGGDPERLEQISRRTMLGRLGDPERDLQGAVAFLASPASAYVTGQTLYVDGGWTAW